jgi:hypothetical protein
LKNDGKKFIEMMEQLAERRMQREEEANAVASGHSMGMSVGQNHISHTHGQPQDYEDDEEYEEEEEEEEEYDEDDEDEQVGCNHVSYYYQLVLTVFRIP